VLTDSEDYELGPLPASILNGREMVTKVHIAVDGGAVLVVEKDGWTIPVFNPEPDLAADLYRNDKIFLKYVVRQNPSRPPHLEVDLNRTEPIEVVSRMVCGHGDGIELNGPLVMFPKSPQITLNVFALRTEDQEGIQQNFTFLTPSNGQDMGDFFLVNRLLQQAWDEAIASAAYDRNKFINRSLRVHARGLKNVISPAQANPQIILNEIFINDELIWQR
jgi:hypothetical protein